MKRFLTKKSIDFVDARSLTLNEIEEGNCLDVLGYNGRVNTVEVD